MTRSVAHRRSAWPVLVAAVMLIGFGGLARAEPARRASVEYDLSLHYGLTQQAEHDIYSIYPSLILGGKFELTGSLQLLARAAATTTTGFENIGGFANAYLGLEYQQSARATDRWTVGAGVTLPLDRSIPLASCYPELDRPSDSLVMSYDWEHADCWKASGLRRSALNRGGWNAWMWAPDWLTLVGTIKAERNLAGRLGLTGELGTGLAFDVMKARAGVDVASIVQFALAPQLRLSPRSAIGVRSSLVLRR